MKTGIYHLMIDGSKSMAEIWGPLSKAVNKHLKNMEKARRVNSDIEFKISYHLFNDSRMFLIADLDSGDLESFSPDGLTAIYEMININISLIQKYELAEIPDEEYMVFFVLITDGHDNKSKEEAALRLYRQINKLQSSGKWLFFFLGADAKIKQINESLKIEAFRYSSFNKTNVGNVLRKLEAIVMNNIQ